jgi:hypothetical protein
MSNLSRMETIRSCSLSNGIGILKSLTLPSDLAGYAEPLLFSSTSFLNLFEVSQK